MNSSPLNPDAPVFIPGSVGSDVLLAESPRKPLPMDDIELPDVAQFQTEAVVRPAELLDLDNCDQLNGHHKASIDMKEHLNGNDKCMDSLGFGFNVGIEPDKVKDSSLIQDFERIQKDTTDFCNIQVFQTHTETNPFAEPFEGNDELFERLKNKERDPMSMSFYQEKDDDTCERLSRSALHVDLNAVQPLPDSDDEDLQTNGVSEHDDEKENISPDQRTELFGSQDSQEPNNDIIRFDDRTDNLLNNIANFGQVDNCNDYSATNNVQPFSNIDFEANNIPQDTVLQTDTPESHKLLFEQIPEIPDGKSSELGFTNDDMLDPDSERDDRVTTPQEETSQLSQESESDKPEEIHMEIEQGITQADQDQIATYEDNNEKQPEVVEPTLEAKRASVERLPVSPAPHDRSEATTPEPAHETEQADVLVHDTADHNDETAELEQMIETEIETPQIQVESERLSPEPASSPAPPRSPAERASPAPHEIALPSESPLPSASPPPAEAALPRESPPPTETVPSPAPTAASLPRASPLPAESPLPQEICLPAESPLPTEPDVELVRESPLPQEICLPAESPLPVESPVPVASPAPSEPIESQASRTPVPEEVQEPIASPALLEEPQMPAEVAQEIREPTPEVAPTPRDLHTEEPIEATLTEAAAPPAFPASPVPASEPTPERVPTPSAEVSVACEAPLAAADRPASPAGPAPDLLRQAEQLVTDLDVGVPESRAQEICVPLTCEIRAEDGERPAAAGTPPPAPAPAPPVEPLAAAPLAAAAAIATGAAVAAVAAKKTPATKKPSTPLTKTDVKTPKSAPKPAAPRTPLSASKRPATAPSPRAPAPRPPPARTSASKPAAPKPTPPASKTPPPIRAPSKMAATGAPAAPKPSAPAAQKPAPKPPVPRAAPAPRVASAPKPAVPRVSAPKPAAPKSASAPSGRSAPRPAAPRKLPDKKPLTNGDVKESKPAPITRPPAARPAAAPPAAPRAAPRAAAPPPPTTARSAPPRARAPLDKLSKDLANKRITARAAPPRTLAKVPSTKTCVSAVSKREAPAVNGAGGASKAPPSPAADGAALPDVIA